MLRISPVDVGETWGIKMRCAANKKCMRLASYKITITSNRQRLQQIIPSMDIEYDDREGVRRYIEVMKDLNKIDYMKRYGDFAYRFKDVWVGCMCDNHLSAFVRAFDDTGYNYTTEETDDGWYESYLP